MITKTTLEFKHVRDAYDEGFEAGFADGYRTGSKKALDLVEKQCKEAEESEASEVEDLKGSLANAMQLAAINEENFNEAFKRIQMLQNIIVKKAASKLLTDEEAKVEADLVRTHVY